MTDQAQLFTLLTIGAGALGSVLWYLIRRSDSRVDAERLERQEAVKEERLAREAAITAERQARDAASAADRKLFLEVFERANDGWMAALEEERRTAKADRHEFRDELSKWVNLFQGYKLEATEKFVNRGTLLDAMGPLRESIDGFRTDVRDLYEKVDVLAQRLNTR